jgi:signal transduction histidine kinase
MKLNSIRWRLTLSYAAIALLAAFSLGLVLHTILRSYYDGQEARYLQSRAMGIGFIASELLEANLSEQVIQKQALSWSFFLQARVQIEDETGKMIADSGVPEFQKILYVTSDQSFQVPVEGPMSGAKETFQVQIIKGEPPSGISTQQDVVFFGSEAVGVAMPADVSMYGLLDSNTDLLARRSSQVVEQEIIGRNGGSLGKVILSDGPAYGDEILNNVMNGWIAAGIVAVLLAAFAGWVVSNRISMPLTNLTRVTSLMASGDLAARADVHGRDEIGTLGHSFNEMAERVEEMVSTLRAFVADAAHELNSPLTALQTNLEMAIDETLAPGASAGEKASAQTLYLSRAQEQGQRLEAMVQSLLDLSRIEATQSSQDFESLDLRKLIKEIAEPFASRAEQAERNFNLVLPEREIPFHGNASLLQHAVNNLLDNALKFTPPNGTITLSLEAREDEVVVTVTDTGIGIPPDDLPHLFERFHRGRNSAEYPGNGLGLAIVKAIVDTHHGRVEVQSTGTGSRFSIVLPSESAT